MYMVVEQCKKQDLARTSIHSTIIGCRLFNIHVYYFSNVHSGQGIIDYTGKETGQGIIDYAGTKTGQGIIDYTGTKTGQGIIDYTGTENASFFSECLKLQKFSPKFSASILNGTAVSAQCVSFPPVVLHAILDAWQRHT